MSAKRRKDPGEGVTFDGGEKLTMSIGALTGAPNEEREPKRGDREDGRAKKEKKGIKKREKTDFTKIAKASLNRERAGRAGKTVTIVRFSGSDIDLEAAAREMRRALGCGSGVEDGAIALQGDIGDRAEQWLLKQGVKRVVRG